mmetsp:Transcript_8440/g.21887  ORF Transcript_8440/g.21887 Transcript_8440/m.21887 type:complete len:122 (-) Transcript_8440:8-373(-)
MREQCYDDALQCIKLRPDWPKAYYRYALALLKLGKVTESRGVCNAGLALEPGNKDMAALKRQTADKVIAHFINASKIDFKACAPDVPQRLAPSARLSGTCRSLAPRLPGAQQTPPPAVLRV